MVWLLEKQIFHHILDLGYEGVAIPIRVKFEFEVQDGRFVPDSLQYEHRPVFQDEGLVADLPSFCSCLSMAA